jgi:ribonuclease BN (tRNA processing enzyme)
VDAVYVSHLHADHFSDLYPLLLQRTRFTPVRVLAPPGARQKLDRWFELLSGNPGLYRSALDVEEHVPGETVKVGPFRVTPQAVEHSVPSFGCRVEAARRVLAYSSDTRLCPQLPDLARDAHLFLCEATLQEGVGDAEFNRRQMQAHLTAAQAGQLAAKAGCRALALTHIMYYLDPGLSVAQAQKECLCPVTAAKEHAGLRV